MKPVKAGPITVYGDKCFASIEPGSIGTDDVVRAQLIANAHRVGMTVRGYIDFLLHTGWVQQEFREAVNDHIRLLCFCTVLAHTQYGDGRLESVVVTSPLCPLHGDR